MEQKILVLAYPGSGKTYLAENYKNVSDFEFQHFRYDYGEYKHLPLEKLKGRIEIRTNNPDWPNNFFKALDDELKKDRVVVVPFATSLLEILDFLKKSSGVRIIFAIQDKESLEDLLQSFKNRGNSEEFIERRRNDFQKCYEIIAQSKFEKVYLNKDEFLSDALVRVGVELEKGVGVKNYI
ncbi:hypothetical protein HYV12_02425 [Candidatus Dojkabacteria bacterium]|nr:hypothetical protein [Candidatus Dojkabacteria bacterium]